MGIPFRFGILMAALLAISGCGSTDLDRGEAERLIRESEKVAELGMLIPTVTDYGGMARHQGLIIRENGRDVLAPDTAATIIEITGRDEIVPVVPLEVMIEVTGLTKPSEESTMTRGEFQWSYLDAPEFIRRLGVSGGTGTANFRIFDDGWRLEKVEVDYSRDNGFALTAEDMAAIERDANEVIEQREAVAKLAQQSWTPTKTLFQTNFPAAQILGTQTITVTDVHVSWYGITRNQLFVTWLGDIDSVELKNTASQPDVTVLTLKGRGIGSASVRLFNNHVDVNKVVSAIENARQAWQAQYGNDKIGGARFGGKRQYFLQKEPPPPFDH